MKRLLLAALAASAAALGATAQPAPGNACFFVRDVGDRSVVGSHTIYFKVTERAHMHTIAYYRVETDGRCDVGANASDPHHGFWVASSSVAAGEAAQVCNKSELKIEAGGLQCAVGSLTRVTPQEIAALPRGLRP